MAPASASSQEKTILVTGGSGFVGTHTVLQLLKGGFRVSIIDNLYNPAIDRVRELAGPDLSANLDFHLVLSSSSPLPALYNICI